MTTLVFLMQRNYQYYNFDLIDQSKYRLICVLDDKHYRAFPQEKTGFFAKRYRIDKNDKGDFFSQFSLDYDKTREIITKEIDIAGSSQNIKIVCVDEMNLLVAAKLRDEFSIPGPSVEDTLPFRDKIAMKKKLVNSDVRIPRFVHVEKEALRQDALGYYQTLVTTVGHKFIVKPVSGASSIFTVVFSDEQSFINKHQEILQHNMDFEAEEFIEGEIYHCDTIMSKGKAIFSVCSRYLEPPITFLSGRPTISLPLKVEDSLNSRLKAQALSVLNALGQVNGASHMEFFRTPNDELVFLEVGARMPGTLIPVNYQKTFGLNPYDLLLRVEMERDVEPIKLHVSHYSFVCVVPLVPGKITALRTPALNSQVGVEWKVKVGDVFGSYSVSLLNFAAIMFVSNSDYDTLAADFESLRNFKFIETSQE